MPNPGLGFLRPVRHWWIGDSEAPGVYFNVVMSQKCSREFIFSPPVTALHDPISDPGNRRAKYLQLDKPGLTCSHSEDWYPLSILQCRQAALRQHKTLLHPKGARYEDDGGMCVCESRRLVEDYFHLSISALFFAPLELDFHCTHGSRVASGLLRPRRLRCMVLQSGGEREHPDAQRRPCNLWRAPDR